MANNEKTYSYTLQLNIVGDKEVKGKMDTVANYLDEYEKKMEEMYVAPFEKAQNATQFIEGNFKPAILTGVKSIDLLNLSLDKQVMGMVDWGKALGGIVPLLGKVHEEAEKKDKSLRKRIEDWLKKAEDESKIYSAAYKAMMDNVTHIIDVYKSGIKNQVDDLKKEIEGVNEQIANVQKQKEASAQKELDLNRQLQASQNNLTRNGINQTKKQRKEEEARIARLKTDIAAESTAKQTLAAEEQRLQEEKEKKQELVAQKEKKMRKIELGQSMIKATVNTAEAVTKMLSLVFPLNLAMAAVASALGIAQIAIIGRQMAKLEEGGLLEGPSHANGGIPILGTNIEVEGGEYVINKNSTAQNRALLDYINTADHPVTAADIANRQGIPLNAAGTPQMPLVNSPSAEERLLEAVEKINIAPVVSVTDIIDVQKSVVSVRDIAGF